MPVTKTNSKRYVAVCDVVGCDWSTGVNSLRIVVSERLRHHLRTEHDLHVVERKTPTMKTPGNALPTDEGLDKLSNHAGSLIAVGKGWTHNTAYSTQFGLREAIEADVYVYDGKKWNNLGERDGDVASQTPIFFKTVIRQLLEAGPDDDFGGVLSQNIPGRKNNREWAILPATGAAAKALDKFTTDF